MNALTFPAVAAAALVLSLAVAGVAFQPVAPAEKRDPGVEERRVEKMSVGEAMGLIGRTIEKLQQQLADPARKDDNLRLINEAQRGAIIAKGQPLPPDVLQNARDEAAKAKLTDTFRKDLITLLRKLLDMETAIAEGKTDAAKAHLDEVLKLGDAAHGRLAGENE